MSLSSRESQPLDPTKVVGLDCEWDEEVGYFMACFDYPIGPPSTQHSKKDALKELWTIQAAGLEVVLHAGRNDFTTMGYYPAGMMVWDTCTLSWLLDENPPHGLKEIEPRYLQTPDRPDPIVRRDKKCYFKAADGKLYRLADAPQDEVEAYCKLDAKGARLLLPVLWGYLPPVLQEWYLEWEVPFDKCLYDMHKRGIKVDEDARAAMEVELTARADRLAIQIQAEVGYNFTLGTGPDLRNVLFTPRWMEKVRVRRHVGYLKTCEHGKAPEKCKDGCVMGREKWQYVEELIERKGLGLIPNPKMKTDTGLPKCDDEALEEHDNHPVVQRLLEWRKLTKLLSTYVGAFPRFMDDEGRIHTRYNQVGTVTGRLSSSDPNLQNVPIRSEEGKAVRTLFVPAEGNVLGVHDLSQIELRLGAGFSGEPSLLRAFANGEDVHQSLADEADCTRPDAKNGAYADTFRSGAAKFAKLVGMDVDLAKALREKIHQARPVLEAWKDTVVQYCEAHGFVYTVSRRKRNLPNIWARKPYLKGEAAREARYLWWEAGTQAINAVIQGSAADHIKVAMVLLWRQGAPILLQVHDEVVLEHPAEQYEKWRLHVVDAFELAAKILGITAPIEVTSHMVERWGDAK